MKKYIKPTMTIANIENETILAGSDVNVLSAGDGKDALSRDRSMFDWGADIEGEE